MRECVYQLLIRCCTNHPVTIEEWQNLPQPIGTEIVNGVPVYVFGREKTVNLFDVTVTYQDLPGTTMRVLAKSIAHAESIVREQSKNIAPASVKARLAIRGKTKVAAFASAFVGR